MQSQNAVVELVAVDSRCLPGDAVVELRGSVTVIAGRGLRAVEAPGAATTAESRIATLVATVAGVLRRTRTRVAAQAATALGGPSAPHNDAASSAALAAAATSVVQYDVVNTAARRYAPEVGDYVVGVIARAVGAVGYQVHIGGAHLATLDVVAFDGATKHSRPRLLPGDLVYAHVVRAEPDLDIVLSCRSLPHMPAKDWVTGEGTFGQLASDGGASVRVPPEYARSLLCNSTPVLAVLGSRTSFEVAVGVNGLVWLSTATQRRPGPATGSADAAAAGGAAPSARGVAAAGDRKALRALVALCQCVAGAATDATPADVESRVNKYFPPTGAAATL